MKYVGVPTELEREKTHRCSALHEYTASRFWAAGSKKGRYQESRNEGGKTQEDSQHSVQTSFIPLPSHACST